jgi:hypothetical protein
MGGDVVTRQATKGYLWILKSFNVVPCRKWPSRTHGGRRFFALRPDGVLFERSPYVPSVIWKGGKCGR